MIESSAIISKGFSGDMGPIGAIGPTGPTGATAIDCGTLAKGNTASYIKSVNINPTDLLITYSDNSSTTITSDVFAGNRLYDATGVTVWKTDSTNGVVSLLVGVSFDGTLGSGSTANFIFKPISSVSGNITLTHGVTFINIDSTSSIYSSGVSADKLIYFNSTTSLVGITTDMSFTGGVLHFNDIGSVIPFTTRLLSNTLVKNIESKVRGSSGSYLDVSEGGLFYINTPNGIMGFTGFSGASGSTGEIRSLTLVIQNDSIWNFPENVWFRPGEASLSCGENILNLTTQDNGKIWKANFFGKGYGVTPYNCLPSQILGRCNHTETCESYVTKEYCDNLLGTFCPLKMCDEGIPTDPGACCINGVCGTGYSELICEKHGGRFFAGAQCDEFFCWDPCYDQPSCCCVEGEDAPRQRYTKTECDLVPGTFYKTCPDSCNVINGLTGACCLDTECVTKTFSECNEFGGVFMGIDEDCTSINCDCVQSETTTCGVGANIEAKEEPGWCLRTYDMLLHGVPIFQENGVNVITLKLNFNTYTHPDRFIIIPSKSAKYTNILRSDPGSIYGSCTSNTKEQWFNIVANTEHPYFGLDNTTITDSFSFYDSGCDDLANKEIIYKITEQRVEMYDTTDPWYKKIRLFVLGNCDSTNLPTSNRTSFKMDINCNGGGGGGTSSSTGTSSSSTGGGSSSTGGGSSSTGGGSSSTGGGSSSTGGGSSSTGGGSSSTGGGGGTSSSSTGGGSSSTGGGGGGGSSSSTNIDIGICRALGCEGPPPVGCCGPNPTAPGEFICGPLCYCGLCDPQSWLSCDVICDVVVGPGGGGVAPSTIFTKPIQIFGDSLNEYITINVIDTASNFNKIGITVPNPTTTIPPTYGAGAPTYGGY